MAEVPVGLLTDDELETLILVTVDGYPDGAPEEDIITVCRWAADIRSDVALLNLVLQGAVNVRVAHEGDLFFTLRKHE